MILLVVGGGVRRFKMDNRVCGNVCCRIGYSQWIKQRVL